ncbi:MAG TPA: hypothetical protein VGM90_14115 [Kofleriaceae bacterium]|jgi:hypothetical protein
MEEEYADVYYVDSRNAVSRDHRAQPSRTGGMSGWLRPRPVAQPTTRTVYLPAPAPAPTPINSTAAMLLGKLTTGQIIEMIAQGFAALQALPGAPVTTRDVETDVANMILYQGALAAHAKRDEQVRTLGNLVARLVG